MNKVIAVILSAEAGSYKSTLAAAAAATKDFEKTAESGGTSVSKFATAAKAAGVVITVALAAIAVAALSMAANFDAAMRNVNSISKMSEGQFQAIEKQVLDLSKTVPQSATILAQGLYDIASSGFKGAEGMEVLEKSAVAASAGMSTTAIAAKGITAVLNSYGLAAADAGTVSDVLFQTVNVGVVTFEELASQIGDVTGIAAAAGVSINEVGAAIAAMTLSGISGAESTTSLNRVIQSLIDPSDELNNLIHTFGYESGYSMLQALGLHGTMEKIRLSTGGNVEELMKLFPEIRAARGAFALMTADGANYAKTFDQIGTNTAVAGATQAAFTEQMKSLSAQWTLFTNRLSAGAIEVGLKAIPVLIDGLAGAQHGIEGLVAAGQAAAERLQPFFDGVVDIASTLGEIAGQAASDFEPLIAMFAALSATAVVATLDAVGVSLSALSAFLDKNQFVIEVLIALWGVKAVAALAAFASKAEFVAEVKLHDWFVKVSEGVKTFIAAQGGLSPALLSIGAMAAPLLVTLPLMAYGIQVAGERAKKAAAETQAYTDALVRSGGVIDENVASLTAHNIVNNEAWSTMERVGISATDVATAVHSTSPEFVRFADGMKRVAADGMGLFEVLKSARDSTDPFVQKLLALYDAGQLSASELKQVASETIRISGEFVTGTEKAADLAAAARILGVDASSGADGLTSVGDAATLASLDVEGLTDKLKELEDTMRAQVDPLFAMQKAIADNAKAQLDLELAQADGTVTAEELAAKQMAVAESALDVNAAALKLEGSIRMGTVSVSAAKAMLQQWVAQGLITQDNADAQAKKFDEVAEAAGELQGKNVTMTLAVDTAAAKQAIYDLQRLANSGVIVKVTPGVHIASRWGSVVEHAADGLLHAGVYNSPMYAFAEPQTGGEAFIPKQGDDIRSKKILDIAAGWYGMRVVPMAAGGIGGGWGGGVTTGGVYHPSEREAAYAQQAAENSADAANAAKEAADSAEQITRDAEAAARELEQAVREQQGREDVRFKVGAMSNDEYRSLLNQRMAATEQFSSEWYSAWQGIQSLDQEVADQQRETMDLIAERTAYWQGVEDNMYQAGAINTETYLASLQARLDGLEQYSDEWLAIMNQMASIEEQQASHSLEILRNKVDYGVASVDELIAALTEAQSAMEKYSNEWRQMDEEINKLKGSAGAAMNSYDLITTMQSSGVNAAAGRTGAAQADLVKARNAIIANPGNPAFVLEYNARARQLGLTTFTSGQYGGGDFYGKDLFIGGVRVAGGSTTAQHPSVMGYSGGGANIMGYSGSGANSLLGMMGTAGGGGMTAAQAAAAHDAELARFGRLRAEAASQLALALRRDPNFLGVLPHNVVTSQGVAIEVAEGAVQINAPGGTTASTAEMQRMIDQGMDDLATKLAQKVGR